MENNFDKFFKDKLEHRQFEMKPEYWEGAEALIEADKRSGGWRKFLIWFGVAFLASFVLVFIWKNNQSTESIGEENIANVNIQNILPDDSENSIAISKEVKNDKSFNQSIIPETKQSEINDEKNNDVSELLQENQVSKSTQNKNEELIESKNINSNTSKNNQPVFSETIPSFEKNNEVKTSLNRENNNNTSTKNISNENIAIGLPNDSEEKDESKSNSEEVISKNNLKSKADDVIVQPIASTSTILLPFLDLFLSKNNKVKELDLNSVWEYEPPRDKYSLGIFGGAVGYPLVENSSQQPFIGFKTGFILHKNFEVGNAKLAVGTELIYHYRSGNFEATKQNEIARYSFGRSIAKAKLTPENLHYFELPLYLQYQKKRMTFESGASFNYLLGVRGKISDPLNADISGWVPSLGFKQNHVNVLLGFHYRISDNLHFGVRANYTPGGILDKNAILPDGITVALQESKPFYLTFRVTQFLKLKK